MTAAQKKAKDNFKKAIAYRKKSGCSLKEAFAHVYGKKVGAVKKKAAPKKKAVKKAAKKKVAKKAAPKKKATVRNYGSHKDTASHNVKISVVSGINQKKDIYDQLEKTWFHILNLENIIKTLRKAKQRTSDKQRIKYLNYDLKQSIKFLKEQKLHHKELKKLI
jgi:hypothetical protein